MERGEGSAEAALAEARGVRIRCMSGEFAPR